MYESYEIDPVEVRKWFKYHKKGLSKEMVGRLEANAHLFSYNNGEEEYGLDIEDERGEFYSITFCIGPCFSFEFPDPTIPSKKCATCLIKIVAAQWNIAVQWT